MTTLLSPPNTACQKAIQYFIAIIIILITGKLISLIPVMGRLQLAGVYKAAEIVWFSTKLFALIMFYYFFLPVLLAPTIPTFLPGGACFEVGLALDFLDVLLFPNG